jgi:phage gp36-like protein
MPGSGGAPYVATSQLGQYGPAATLALVPPAVQTQACIDATARADSYMNDRYVMPLLGTIDPSIVQMTAYIAWYLMMDQIGWAPQAGSDANIKTRYYEAIGYPDRPGSGWFPGVARQAIHPAVTPSVPDGQGTGNSGPVVTSQPVRGWQQVRNGKSVVGGF